MSAQCQHRFVFTRGTARTAGSLALYHHTGSHHERYVCPTFNIHDLQAYAVHSKTASRVA